MTVSVLAAGATSVAGVLYGLDRLANRVVKPMPRHPERDVHELGVPVEDVTIPSSDHLLAGWLLAPEGSERRALVLLAHGWGANYGTVVDLAEPLVAAGHPVLLYDVRGHGRSGTAPYVTVRHFRDDAMAAARWAADRYPDSRRILVGHSMGAAAAVLAAADGAPVHGVVSIAGPASVLDVTSEWLTGRGLPGPILVRILLPFWWRRAGGSFRPLTPELRARDLPVPLMLIQPENDERVGRHHADRLSRATGLPVHVIDAAGHTDVLRSPQAHRLMMDFLTDAGG